LSDSDDPEEEGYKPENTFKVVKDDNDSSDSDDEEERKRERIKKQQVMHAVIMTNINLLIREINLEHYKGKKALRKKIYLMRKIRRNRRKQRVRKIKKKNWILFLWL